MESKGITLERRLKISVRKASVLIASKESLSVIGGFSVGNAP